MEATMIAVERNLDHRTKLVDALTIVLDLLESDVYLEFASGRILSALRQKDYECAAVTFDVLNIQCNGRLPVPIFMERTVKKSRGPEMYDPNVGSEPSMTYSEQLMLAADLLNSSWSLNSNLDRLKHVLAINGERFRQNTPIIIAALETMYTPAIRF